MGGLKNIKIGFLNPGSLSTHHEEFLVALERHNVDILGLNETWLRSGEEGRAPKVAGYRLCHLPRPEAIRSRGGGVGFYIRRGLSTQILKYPIEPRVEQMWLRTRHSNKTVIIGTAYRPPWLNVQDFLDALT